MPKHFKGEKYRITPGLAIERNSRHIDHKMHEIRETKDTENRQYVINKVKKYIIQGKNIEEAIELIMQEDIINSFEYLTKNGLDIRTCIKNWVTSNMNSKQKNRGQER